MSATGTPNRHTVHHYSHAHPLTETNGIRQFTCDGCKTYGFGMSFRCDACNYDLHDYCATCPSSLRTFMHPHHDLRLLWRGPDLTCQSLCTCNVCGEAVKGLYYRCDSCDFDVHPLCTLLPQHVTDLRHPGHRLELSHWGDSTCVICRGTCRSWRYRCVTCGFDYHMECVLAMRDTSPIAETRLRGLGVPPAQPYPYPCHYGQHHGPMNPGHGSGYPLYPGHGSSHSPMNPSHGSGYGLLNSGHGSSHGSINPGHGVINPGHGSGYGPMNPGHNVMNPGHGSGHGPFNPDHGSGHLPGNGPGWGRTMFNVIWALTVGVACNLATGPIQNLF